MPEISVVMPTYRRPAFLAQALASLRDQTLADYEVLVCDNGADRETEQVVRDAGDPRIRYMPREQNLGILRSAMLGFSDARSELVMKLDDDDRFLPDTLERLVAPFRSHPGLGISFGGVTLVDEHGDPMVQETAALDRSSGRATLPEGLIAPATGMVAAGGVQLAGAAVRKDVVSWLEVPDEIGTAFDFFAALAAVERGRPAHFTRAPVVHYRMHAASDTALRQRQQMLASCAVVEYALAEGRHLDGWRELEDRLALSLLNAARLSGQEGLPAEARSLARRSLRARPSVAAARVYALGWLPAAAASRVTQARAARADHQRREPQAAA